MSKANIATGIDESRSLCGMNGLNAVIRAVVKAARVEQVVLLGAGYDMRAYRFAKALRERPLFEIDHPATQAGYIAHDDMVAFEKAAYNFNLGDHGGGGAGAAEVGGEPVDERVGHDRVQGRRAVVEFLRRQLELMLGREHEVGAPGHHQLLVERLALVLQGSLLVRHSSPAVADAFCASRLP